MQAVFAREEEWVSGERRPDPGASGDVALHPAHSATAICSPVSRVQRQFLSRSVSFPSSKIDALSSGEAPPSWRAI